LTLSPERVSAIERPGRSSPKAAKPDSEAVLLLKVQRQLKSVLTQPKPLTRVYGPFIEIYGPFMAIYDPFIEFYGAVTPLGNNPSISQSGGIK
jgi:hypothetical protein